MLANSLGIVMRRLSFEDRWGVNSVSHAEYEVVDKYPRPNTGDDLMTLREIVDDVELQRVAVLKNNAKRANQQLKDARARLKMAKAKQAMLRARMPPAV